MAEKLSIQIALEGAAEIEQQLAGISKAGQQCFADIQKAAANVGGLKNLDTSAIEQSLKKFGITATTEIDKIKTALNAASKLEIRVLGVSDLEQNFNRAGDAATRATAAFGLTRRELGALRTTLRQVDLGPIGNQLATMGRIGSAFGPIGITITALGAAVAGVVAAFKSFANSAIETATAVDQLATAGKTSFEFMSSLQIAFAQGGTSLKKFTDEMGNLQEKIAAAGQEKAIRDAISEGDKDTVDWANNLDEVRKKFEQLAKGTAVTFSPLTKLDVKVQAVLESLAKLKDPEEQLLKLADIFRNLSSDAERAQLGKALGLSPEFIATLSHGSDALRAIQAEAQRLGIVLGTLDKQNLSGLKSAQSTVGALWDALINKMGALASPAFLSFWEGLGARIKELIPDFLALAEAFGGIDLSSVGRGVADFALSLGKMAVEFAKAIEAASKGDWSGVTAQLQIVGNQITEIMVGVGTKVGQAFVGALLSSITAGIKDFSLADLGRDIDKFFTSVLKNWEILKGKLSGGFISPAGAAEAGGGQLGGADFGPMIAGAEVAAVRIKQVFADAFSQSITPDFSSITNAAQTAATDLQLLFFTASQQITETFSTIDIASALSAQIDDLIAQFKDLTAAATAAAAAAGSAAGGGGAPAAAPFARGGFFGGRGTGTSDSNLAWLSRGEYIMPARAVAQPGVLAFLEAMRRSGRIPGFAQGGFAGGGSVDFVRATSVGQIVQAINSLAESIAAAFGLVAREDTLTSGISAILQAIGTRGGNARGGLLGGRGTGTSDSNLAWVSRGEHIMPARAVGQPGVLAFLEALRRSGGNLREVLDGMGRFALGGMVPQMMPAFAGSVGGMSHVTIQFPGLPAIGGLRASSAVVDELHRAAALAQVRSGGRKPSRYS